MKNLLNYSHPLGSKAKEQLKQLIGEFQEIVVPCQIDMDAPIKPQLDKLVEQGFLPGAIHVYIPPALSVAAGYVTARLSYAQSDAMLPEPPRMVVLKKEGLPPQFVVAEII